MAIAEKKIKRERRKRGVKKKIHGTSEIPRLNVFRSNRYIYVQIINDDEGKTLISATSLEKGIRLKEHQKKIEVAFLVGKAIGEKAKKLDIKKVVFDRNGYLYHGQVKALAEGAREAGLEF